MVGVEKLSLVLAGDSLLFFTNCVYSATYTLFRHAALYFETLFAIQVVARVVLSGYHFPTKVSGLPLEDVSTLHTYQKHRVGC